MFSFPKPLHFSTYSPGVSSRPSGAENVTSAESRKLLIDARDCSEGSMTAISQSTGKRVLFDGR